jgi:hypothetical protein
MRLWLSGPRLLGGLVRPGISLGKEDFRSARKAPAMVAEATLGLFRRPDGAILMAIAHMNGDADTMPDMTPVAVFASASVPASVEVREGARVRLAKHIGPDGLVAGLSVGQVVAAIKAEMEALDVEGKFVRIKIETAPEPGTSGLIHSDDSQIGRSSPSSHYESRNCRQRHASRKEKLESIH